MFKQHILKMSSKEFEKLSKFVHTGFLFLAALLFTIAFLVQFSDYANIILLLSIVFAIFSIILIDSINKALRYILHKEKDLKKYRAFLEAKQSSLKNWKIHKVLRAESYLNFAILTFHEGNFRESIAFLDKITIDTFPRLSRKAMAIEKSFLLAFNYLLLGESVQFEIYYQNLLNIEGNKKVTLLKNRYLTFLETFRDLLLLEKENHFFDDRPEEGILSDYFKLYCSGLNAKLMGDNKSAKKYFGELAKGSSDFYFVREAKYQLAAVTN
ncbi:hypothetical protein [Streptococcus sp. CSL10205-OR2]|uniref:hypothetical protein n=1 Tax=Streptococcus sp. CSL10205-OR2 TaxID=2980558 RepID=UPI0021D9A726|nr:hypothetical protein [Streptococcus sp. CSL10205-OR2]MCU9533318.1 hypothetical protein [Streptococcus sp. CSL10205-OR2]